MYNSNLESSKIKSKSFTTTVDQYSQISVSVPGTMIAAWVAGYLAIVQNDNYTLRVFGNIGIFELNKVSEGVTVSGVVFYF